MVAALAALILTPAAAWTARRLDIVDHPGPLKLQARPVAYLGGLAVLVAVALPVVLWQPSILLPLIVAAILGLLDDVVSLSAQVRLCCEAANGFLVAAVVLPSWEPLSVAVTILTVVVLINAVNLIDGLDGLATGVGAVAAAGFAIHLGGSPLALAVLGGLMGFLVYNRPPARIYLGDSGSYLIGTALAMLLITGLTDLTPVARSATTVLFVAVPVADAAVAIARRWRAGAPLLFGDRAHIYDQLVDRGLTRGAAAAWCVGAQVVLVAVGLSLGRLPPVAALISTILCVVVVSVVLVVTFTAPPAPEV